jgi:hypothetical protein
LATPGTGFFCFSSSLRWSCASLQALIPPFSLSDRLVTNGDPYELTDMVLWDKWRMLHCANGMPAGQRRHMRRTTIAGDYGLGRFEKVGTVASAE